MNFLNNLSLRVKLLLLVIPILGGLGYFTFIVATESYDVSQQMNKLSETVKVSLDLGGLAHEIQKERGNSSGFLSSKGQQFGEPLSNQRVLSNEQIEVVKNTISTYKSSILAPYEAEIEELETLIDDVPYLRTQVDNLELLPNEAIREYTKINTLAIDIVESFGQNLGDVNMYAESEAYVSFLKSKERAGIERAIGTQGFVLGRLPQESFIWFANLVAEQNAFNKAFVAKASDESNRFFEDELNIDPVAEVERMREKLFANENLDEEPQYWFQQITLKINALKKVEDYLAQGVSNNSANLSNNATASFKTTLIAAAVGAVLVIILLFAILTNLLGNIKKLSTFSSRVSKGELRARVNIKSKDELGSFAKTMNRMVASVKKASDQLKVERNKARYMYKNIYRTSEVVFANATEGFFLIDKELKISSLYSKSTEGIFEQKEVGGRDFLDFVNPRLLPRDREALKVFSKHLFNPKIKDRVLNHLNPVESVSIYGDDESKTEGVKTKFLKISFQRIKGENGAIREVMVTAKDETQEVQLKKQIETDKKKNKQETEQLLNIIKMDPVSLQEYLDRAQESIEDINRSFEEFKGSNFRELVIYTFNIIHNLKGNAGLIEFDLMEDKFNAVEDQLIQLRNKDIDGQDFIKVLYEIKEIQFSMMDMARMLRRIANIYQSSKEADLNVASNLTLEHSFEKITNKLNESTNKEARFRVVNNDDVLIPEHLKISVNDIVIQLIRNSFAHGIEDVEVRESNGKPGLSSIKLVVDSDSDELRLKYEDDGIGIDVEKVFDQAKELGTFDPDKKRELGDAYAYELIFNDGLSTNERKGLSGRGQGMSLIRSLIYRHEASYRIQSDLGKGFCMEIDFPLENKIELKELIA